MARSVAVIQQQILDAVAADPTLGPLLAANTSKRAYFALWAFITATNAAQEEQLIDIMNTEVEGVAAAAPPAGALWLQAQIFKFQYSLTNPQVIQLINFAPAYPIIDSTLQIITRCSVATDLAFNVNIKVAKQNPPIALVAAEISALSAYLNPGNGIGIMGINYNVTSLSADLIYIQAQVYYQGQYAGIIQTNIVAALNALLANLSAQGNFGGAIKISDIELAIRAVAGVNDVILQNISARAAATPWGSGTALVTNSQVISRAWNMVSGYIIGETTTGQTFNDSISYIAQ